MGYLSEKYGYKWALVGDIIVLIAFLLFSLYAKHEFDAGYKACEKVACSICIYQQRNYTVKKQLEGTEFQTYITLLNQSIESR